MRKKNPNILSYITMYTTRCLIGIGRERNCRGKEEDTKEGIPCEV